MHDVQRWYEFVLAQMAADSYLDSAPEQFGLDFKNEDELAERLGNGANHYREIERLERESGPLSATRMTRVMTNDFNRIWEVIDHLPNTTSGFSATVLKHRGTGEYTLSFRSTESKDFSDGGDVERDSFHGANGQISFDGFAWAQLRDMENYYEQLKAGALANGSASDGFALATWLGSPEHALSVTGYSLGGHLAHVFTLMHPNDIDQTYVFNGAGFGAISDLDPLTQYGPAIRDRIGTLNAILADPVAFTDHFSPDSLADVVETLSGVELELPLPINPSAVFALINDLKNQVFDTLPPARIYDDPVYKLALAALPGDTSGALPIGLKESVNYTREQITANDKVTNLYGHSFSGERPFDEVTAGSGHVTGSYFPVYIEDQPLFSTNTDFWPLGLDAVLRSFGPTHSIALLVDSLAVMDLYVGIDRSLIDGDSNLPDAPPTQKLNRLFEAMTNTRARLFGDARGEGNTLETALDSLGHLVVGDAWTTTSSDDAPGAYGRLEDREAFYANLQRLRDALFDDGTLRPGFAGLAIVPLAGFEPAMLAERATTDIAYRYALQRMNPFVVTGDAALYEKHNQDSSQDGLGALDVARYSATYWLDRAHMLAGRITANVESRSTTLGDPYVPAIVDVDYFDVSGGHRLHAVTPLRTIPHPTGEVVLNTANDDRIARVMFSHAGVVDGANANDRLYGADGENILIGHAGEDVIEAGSGNDTLYGNDQGNADDRAADFLKGGPGNDVYYASNGDFIEDTDGRGRIHFGGNPAALGDGYRDPGMEPGTYLTSDSRHRYVYDDLARVLTITTQTGGASAPLTVTGYNPGHLGIALHEFSLPDERRFIASDEADRLTVTDGAAAITGFVAGAALEPAIGFDPSVGTIIALAGDDVITVNADVSGIRIYGDSLNLPRGDDGHDDIAIDVFGAGVVTPDPSGVGAYVNAGGGNDWISGGRRGDRLSGEAGNDRISGNAGNDRISGGEADRITEDNDVLSGEAGNDHLYGYGGDDLLLGGQNDDVLVGGDGDDVLYGDAISWGFHVSDRHRWRGPQNAFGSATYTSDSGDFANIVTPTQAGHHAVFTEASEADAGRDHLRGGAGSDHLLGGAGDDLLEGGADRDLLEGEAGDDTLAGGDGNDILYGDISPATFSNDSAIIASGPASNGIWTLSHRKFPAGADVAGNDSLDGGAGTDALFGGDGHDTLDGGRFDRSPDVLSGGDGNDTYVYGYADGPGFIHDASGGADRLLFRAGIEPGDVHVSVDDTGTNLIVRLSLNGIDLGDELIISNGFNCNAVESFEFDSGLTWTLPFIETLTGRDAAEFSPVDDERTVLAATDHDDVAFGNAGADEAHVLAGNDYFAGAGGDDRIFGGGGADALQGNDGDDTVSGETGDDTLYGQSGNDTLFGGTGDDSLSGGDGADVLYGGAGADDLLGGTGDDTYHYRRGDGDDSIRDDGGSADRIVFGDTIEASDITIDASGETIILEVRDRFVPGNDRLTLVDGLRSANVVESIEFASGEIWGPSNIAARLPDAHRLAANAHFIGGAGTTTYALDGSLTDGFVINITDIGGVDTIDFGGPGVDGAARNPLFEAWSRDGDDVLFNIIVPPEDSGTGEATGTLRIIDFFTGGGFIETIRIGTTVLNGMNTAPLVTNAIADQMIELNLPFEFRVPAEIFSDDPFDRITLTAAASDGGALPEWLRFDPETRIFSGTPQSGDAAINAIRVTATDRAGLTASTDFALNVGKVNVAPTINLPQAIVTATEGAAFSFRLPDDVVVDPDSGDTVVLTASLPGGGALPGWLAFDHSTRTFNGIPGAQDVGLHAVTVTATDAGGLGAADTFIVHADYLNDAPVLGFEIGVRSLTEQASFSFSLAPETFSDPDAVHGDALVYALDAPESGELPGWLRFDPTSLTFSGRPVAIFGDTDFNLRVTATDSRGATTATEFTLEVADVTDAIEWFVPHAVSEIGEAAYSRSGSASAALTTGGYIVVWESAGRDGDERGIFAQRHDPSGSAIGPVIRVNTTTRKDQRSPAVAGLADGGFVVSWVSLHEDDGTQVPVALEGGGVYARQFAVDGTGIGTERRVAPVWSGVQNQSRVAALSDGSYFITWFSQFDEQWTTVEEFGLGEPGMFGQRYSGTGAPIGDSRRLFDADLTPVEPDIAGLNNGGFVMTWTVADTDGSGIAAQRYSDAGTRVGPRIPVNSWADDMQSNPNVAALATGGFVIVWRSEDQDYSGGGIYGQRFDHRGNALGHEFRINTTTAGSQGDPAVTGTPDGGFVVSWISGNIDGIGDVYVQHYDARGATRGGETLLDASLFQNDAPAIVALNDGSLVHTWTATDSGGISTNPNLPWELADPTRIESKHIALRANTELTVVRPAVTLETAEFRNVIYRVEDNVFFDPDLPFGDAIRFTASRIDGSPLPEWLAFDRATATLSGLPLSGEIGAEQIRITATELAGTVAESIVTINVAPRGDATVVADPATYTANSSEPMFNLNPSAVTLADGSRVVVWETGDGIFGQGFAANGVALGTEFRIDDGEGATRGAALAALDNGGFVVAWKRENSKIYARRYDAAGTRDLEPFEIGDRTTGTFHDIALAGLAGGGFVATWREAAPDGAVRVRAQRFSDAVIPTPRGHALTIAEDTLADGLAVTSLADSGFVVTWVAGNEAGETTVFARQYDAAGTAIGGRFAVNEANGLLNSDVAVAALATGGFLVSWTTQVPGGDDENIHARVFDPEGRAATNEWRVNNYTTSNQRESSVLGTNDGGFVISWNSERWTTPSEYGFIQAQHFDRDGRPNGDFFEVSLESTMRRGGPTLAGARDGGFDIFWSSDHESEGGETDRILGRHFNVRSSGSNLVPVVARPISDRTISEDSAFGFFVPPGTIIDPDGGPVRYRASLAGGASLPGWLAFDAETRRFSGTPTNADVGDYSIAITGTDDKGDAVADTFSLAVENTNDEPVAVRDLAGLRLDGGSTAVTVDVLANDTDPDEHDHPGTLILDSVAVVGGIGRATIVDNRLRFDAQSAFDHLTPGEIAQVDVNYVVSDPAGATAAGLATIAIHNDTVILADGSKPVLASSPASYFGFGDFSLLGGSSGSRISIGGGAFLSSTPRDTRIIISGESGVVHISRPLGNGIPGQGTLEAVALPLRKTKTSIGSMLLTFEGTDTAIHIGNFDPDDVFAENPLIETFVFDGIEYSYAEFVARGFDLDGTPGADVISGTNTTDRLTGFGGDDILAGGAGDDTINGGPGDDTLEGGPGDDTFLIGPGDGHDIVSDAGGVDRIVFGAGMSSAAAVSTRIGDDLRVSLTAEDSVTVKNWFDDVESRIETFVFTGDDVRIVDANTVASLQENHPPLLNTPITDRGTLVGDAFRYVIAAGTFSDPDRDSTLSLSASSGDGHALPDWLAFDPLNHVFSGTPGVHDIGRHTITVTAADNAGLTVSDTFELYVASSFNTINGTALPDTLIGTDGADLIFGLAGNDRLDGQGGSDELFGGDGADDLFGGDGDDSLHGGDGNDTLVAGAGNNRVTGGPGNDRITTGAGNDRIDGGAGRDRIYSGAGDDMINGGDGNDQIRALRGDHEIDGGAGNDLVITGAGRDVIHGGSGNDRIVAGTGDNRVFGDDGNDRVTTGGGDDRIDGGDGRDRIYPGAGDDTVFGGDGDDIIRAVRGNHEIHGGANDDVIITGAGRDRIYGDAHDDRISSGSGADYTDGGSGDDTISAGPGDDVLLGGPGSDTLIGGRGDDRLVGGGDADTYRFGRFDGVDTIVETEAGAGDTIEFGAGITPAQIWFSKSGANLRLDLVGTPDAVVVQDWYARDRSIEQFETRDGDVLENSRVDELVQAMAAFDVPTGGEWSLSPDITHRLDPVLAAVWSDVG